MLGPLSPSAIKRALSPAPRGAGSAAEEQRRLTEHLRRNLGLASLRVTISTEQRKQLEGALRTWTEQMRRLAYRRLKAMWLAETSVAFHRWLLLRRGVVGWCALMNAVHRQRQRTALLRLQALGALLRWRQWLRAHNVRAALAQRGAAGWRHVALKRGLPIVWCRRHAEALLAAEMLLTAAKWHRLTGCAARLPRWRAKATATRAAAAHARTAAAAHAGAASADALCRWRAYLLAARAASFGRLLGQMLLRAYHQHWSDLAAARTRAWRSAAALRAPPLRCAFNTWRRGAAASAAADGVGAAAVARWRQCAVAGAWALWQRATALWQRAAGAALAAAVGGVRSALQRWQLVARRSASLRALASRGISGRAAVHLAAATRFWSTATRRRAHLRAAAAALLSTRHEAIAAWGLHAWTAAARALKLRAHAGAALKRLANARWVRAWEQWRAVAAGDRAAATLRRAADALRGLRRMEAAWARWTGLVQRNSALAQCTDDAARAARALRAWRGLARAWAVWHERMRRTLRAR